MMGTGTGKTAKKYRLLVEGEERGPLMDDHVEKVLVIAVGGARTTTTVWGMSYVEALGLVEWAKSQYHEIAKARQWAETYDEG